MSQRCTTHYACDCMREQNRVLREGLQKVAKACRVDIDGAPLEEAVVRVVFAVETLAGGGESLVWMQAVAEALTNNPPHRWEWDADLLGYRCREPAIPPRETSRYCRGCNAFVGDEDLLNAFPEIFGSYRRDEVPPYYLDVLAALKGRRAEDGMTTTTTEPRAVQKMPPANEWLENYLEEAKPSEEKAQRRARAKEVAMRMSKKSTQRKVEALQGQEEAQHG